MRRLGVACAVLMLTLIFQTAASFAGTLQIVNSHPKDGATGVYPLNAAVKVYFDQDVSSAKGITENNNRFMITGPTDEETGRPHIIVPVVLYDPKNPEMVLVVLNQELEPSAEYRLTISGEFMIAGGDLLGDDVIIRFTTRDMQSDMQTSMIMMIGFFIVIMIISTKQMKRQIQKEAEENDDSKVNPYKVSKKTGKSVAEIVEKSEKQKRKKAAEEEKFKVKEKVKEVEYEDDEYEYYDFEEESDNHRVAEARPISAFSSYKSGKKAKAEAAAKKKAVAGTTRPKNQSGKTKNKKKK
jgi:predicted lactoylglutathione lyase